MVRRRPVQFPTATIASSTRWRFLAMIRDMHRCAATIAFSFMAQAALAADFSLSSIRFDGFGTVGATYQNASGLEYRQSVTQPHGARSGELDLATNSLVGLQSRRTIGPQLQATVQAVARLNSNSSWWPSLERAYLSFAPSASILLRAGRVGFDSYLQAESPSVGYTLFESSTAALHCVASPPSVSQRATSAGCVRSWRAIRAWFW